MKQTKKTRISPRNGIRVPDVIPKRWQFLANHIYSEKTWIKIFERIDTVAEHADALMCANGLSAKVAIDKAINDLIKEERASGESAGDYWRLTPTHRKAIEEYLNN
jgi:hypothetical protein